MIVDLHVHTSTSSSCSDIGPHELIERAVELGLDGIAVTEHGVVGGAEFAREIGLEQGFLVLRGIEVHTALGDVLVFGLDGERYHDVAFSELMQEVHARHGVAVMAHPARGFWGRGARYRGAYPEEVYAHVHAVETHNGGCSLESNERASGICERFGLASTGGSDAHRRDCIGSCVTVFDRSFESEREFMEEIRAGRCRGAYLDELVGGRPDCTSVS